MNVFDVSNLRITTASSWFDVTTEIEQCDPPFTLARPQGVGAIQFSTAEHIGGKSPQVTLKDLSSLVTDFAKSRNLDSARDFAAGKNHLLFAAANFDFGNRFLRVWYCSDGKNIALVTYNCDKGSEQIELPDCEDIIRNLRFIV